MGARTYDPKAGRFLQVDPIEFHSKSLNLYAYVDNDPFNFSDPSGLRKGSIRRRGLAGPATVEFQALGPAAQVMRQNAINAIGRGALDAISKGMVRARVTLKRGKISPTRTEDHHCHPTSMGGSDDKKNMSKIRRIRHMFIHRLMRMYLKNFVKSGQKVKNNFIGIDPGLTFSATEIEVIIKQFYRDIDQILGVRSGC